MKHTFRKFKYNLYGVEIGNPMTTWEDIFISDRKMTEQEVLLEVSKKYLEKGYIVTQADFYRLDHVTIDLLTNEIEIKNMF